MGGANSLGQHECAVDDCHIKVSTARLMCAYHWFKVPVELRREVSSAYTSYRYRQTDRTWQEYIQTRGRAIEAVAEVMAKIRSQP